MTEKHNYIIVAALNFETKGLEGLAPIIHTGVGKVNAAISCYQAIIEYKPGLVINYGTAGTVDNTYGLQRVDTIVQRDMDVRCLGFPRGVTPYSDIALPPAKGVILGSGDSFVTNFKTQLEGLDIAVSLIDMEAFAIQEVCRHHDIAFECYKYVTDDSDASASTDWLENVEKGAYEFKQLLKKNYGPSSLK